MHLKSYPKLVRSELRLDAVGVQTFVSHQGALLKTCSSNHGNISSRLPLSVLSTNTLRCSNTTNHFSSSATSLRLKASPSGALQLLPPLPGNKNNTLRLYQTATEDADAPLDIWAVIKPGHVREKIAIFALDGGRTEGTGDSERTSTAGSGGRERMPAAGINHGAMTGMLRAGKAKGSWEENCNAKRRRRSGIQQDTQQPSPRQPDSTQQSGNGWHGDAAVTAEEEEEEEQKVSVVEMVAFLEHRVNEQQSDSKPLVALQRSSTTITLSRASPPDARGEEPESIRVSDMVARLESECLRRRAEGDLSRSNSLRRTVERVLFAARDQSPASSSPSSVSSSRISSPSSSQPGTQSAREPISCSQTVSDLTTPPSPAPATPLPSGEAGLETQAPPPPSEEAEPLPGLLFLSVPPVASETLLHTDSLPESRPPRHRATFDLQPPPPAARSDSGSQSEKRRRKAERAQEVKAGSAVVPAGRRASASQDFLLMRQRLQQLLEPQPFLAVLPHHLLVKIFLLLPTHTLAALKCTCHYFSFIIDNYGVRPADSLWVSDPRYHDDPCKQCKKRYGRGDVSLCRWHHKPYCQALPYGPGYWMCCHGAHRDAPGCNVGLHDNRWVPAFHSINAPIYRRSRHDDP
ncbi:F-box only protein 34 [Dicentrarchus labrax]|uniref:F-box only protein 34 n=1 Tax=Dicentrarchus labrax TaxID=13489 RepID=UPI0021F51F43|nr:F-box only protein 34 [Dicentrarchus labrax]